MDYKLSNIVPTEDVEKGATVYAVKPSEFVMCTVRLERSNAGVYVLH